MVDGFARESYEYMYARPWSRVVDFYAELVRAGAGAAGLAKLFGNDEVGTNIFFWNTLENCASIIWKNCFFKRGPKWTKYKQTFFLAQRRTNILSLPPAAL